ncbi:MAG: phenylalanine--tRNA ligase beta subunit-related protein [Gemmatimonadota bacterium]
MTNDRFQIEVDPHPLLRPAAFTTRFPGPLGEIAVPPSVTDLLSLEGGAHFQRDESLRMAVRDMLRHWGHKPAGRGKPASEYLVGAVDRGELGSINAAVDVCNAVSLHSGFPIALVDMDRARPPFRVAPGAPDATYVFNASGQEMALKGLICLSDAEGPCANPVKDAQRTKTHEWTTRTLTVIWGVAGYEDRLAAAVTWYQEALGKLGAAVETVEVVVSGAAPSGCVSC